MAKRKDSVALYEVIGKSRQARAEAGLTIPAWMGRHRSDALPVPAVPAVSDEDRLPVTLPPPVAKTAAATLTEPPVSISQGRLRLSLTYVICVAAGAALVLLLVAMFLLGRASAPSPRAEKAEAGAAAEASAGAIPGGTKAPPPARSGIVREKGKYYLVVQGMGGKSSELLTDARAIERFCRSKGEPVDVNEYTGSPRQYMVLSGQGFESSDSQEAANYVAAIEALGKNYKAQGGKYEFKQRDVGGRLKPWFVPWK